MAELLQKDDQVIYRHQMRTGTAVEYGSIVRIDEDGINASVHFPVMNRTKVVPVSDLQKTTEVYGGVRPNLSPARRTIRTMIPQ